MLVIDLGCLLILSWLLVDVIGIIRSNIEKLALTVALALAIKSLILFIMIACDLPLDLLTQAGFGSGLLFCTFVFIRFRKRPARESQAFTLAAEERGSRTTILAAGILGILFVLALINAWFFPITESDGIWYEVRGRLFFYNRELGPQAVVPQFRQYPPFIPLLYAYLLSLDVEALKIIFPVIYLCMIVIVYCRIVAFSRNREIAAIFTLILGTTPFFWWHSVLPLLDLTASAYYSIGILYWFFLAHDLQNNSENNRAPAYGKWGLLSGLFFGIAAWTRPEYLLYCSIPLVLSMYLLDLKTSLDRKSKNRIFFALAVPMLVFPTVWLWTMLSFEFGSHGYSREIVFACASLWLLAGGYGAGWIRGNGKTVPRVCWVAGTLYVVVLFLAGPKTVSPVTAFAISLFRTVFVNLFFSFTIVLALFLLWRNRETWSEELKLLGMFLILFIIAHFALFSYTEPKWAELEQYLSATFLHPGNSVNLSDTRGMMALYPAFVFFISCLSKIQKSFRNV